MSSFIINTNQLIMFSQTDFPSLGGENNQSEKKQTDGTDEGVHNPQEISR